MAHIVIAGKANDSAFAEAEMLGYHLTKNLPDFHVSVESIHPDKWNSFVSLKFQTYRWDIRPARDRQLKSPGSLEQLIWIKSGELIGDADSFLTYIQKTYNQSYPLSSDLLQGIAVENMAQLQVASTSS